MKVRIAGNSIRFRLKQSEVKHFQETGEISEIVRFGISTADQLSFTLQTFTANSFQILYQCNAVVVLIPQSISNEWAATEQVGFDATVDTGKGEAIYILVEKDFKCLDRNDIEDEDAYPNPNMHC